MASDEDDEDAGAPPAHPRMRVTTIAGGGDFVLPGASPARSPLAMPAAAPMGAPDLPDAGAGLPELRALRARCLELAARDGAAGGDLLERARALMAFVERG